MEIKIECAHDKVVALADLKPHPANPNKHPEQQIALLAKIIKAQGWRNPIVVSNRSGLITKGHGRYEAAKLIGAETAPVDFQDYANEKQELADMIADNRIAELAEPDRTMLRELAEQLDDGSFDMDLTGFDQVALEELMTAAPPESDIDAEPQIDKAAELAEKWGVKRGQIWQLGEHRLMCGDCTVSTDVIGLVKTGVDLIITSPPYNVGVEYNTHDDSEMPWPHYEKFLTKMLESVTPCLKSGRAFIWNIGTSPKTHHVRQHILIEKFGLTYYRQMIWKKVGVPVPLWFNTVRNPRARQFTPNYQHEIVLIFTNGKLERGEKIQLDELCENDVFEYGQQFATTDIPAGLNRTGAQSNLNRRSKKAHPAAFPVRIPKMFITHFTSAGEITLEPFAGAGTTIIACEQLGRKCRAMEIDPGYCAVSIQRWADATGKKPKLITPKEMNSTQA